MFETCLEKIKQSLSSIVEWKNVQWKNPPAKPNQMYQPTTIEQIANTITHGMCILPSITATWMMASKSSTPSQFWASVIYGSALIALFSVSTCFHTICLCNCDKLKPWLHRGDRAMIYLFIAACYFPWLTLLPRHEFANQTSSSTISLSTNSTPDYLPWLWDGLGMDPWLIYDIKWAVWLMAALGILYQQLFHEKYKWLETFLYIAIGILPALPFVQQEKVQNMWELKLGGACYLIGVVFFKADGRVPLAHAIWHIHVAMGAAFHYYAVLTHLIN
nr:EOG090X0FVK [Lepidurus arcticus]